MLGLIVIVFLISNLHACGWHHYYCPLLCACIDLAGNIDTNSPYMLNYWAGPSKIVFWWWLAPQSPEAMFNRAPHFGLEWAHSGSQMCRGCFRCYKAKWKSLPTRPRLYITRAITPWPIAWRQSYMGRSSKLAQQVSAAINRPYLCMWDCLR